MIHCQIPDCGNKHFGRGWCEKHYRRWYTKGDPNKTLRAAKGEPEQYLHEVVFAYEGDDCMPWPFAKTSRGYGNLFLDGRNNVVPRLVCEYVNGPPPTPVHEAAHSCGKGHEGCVTKRHLSWKTPKENQGDRAAHGTAVSGEKHGNAKLTDEQVRRIRTLGGKETHKDIACRFNVSRPYITRILNGVSRSQSVERS